MSLVSKYRTFRNISAILGIFNAISETFQWAMGVILRQPYDARFRVARVWISMLANRGDISGAEIGVRYGENAEYLLDVLDINRLYLIDPYDAYEEYQEDWNNEMMTEAERIAQMKLGNTDAGRFVKKYSDDAIADLPDNLDFVYIDGNHEYEYVKNDLSNYYPVVKKGGILAGHDYTKSWPGVVEAVNEFTHERGLEVTKDLWGDWFIQKPVDE